MKKKRPVKVHFHVYNIDHKIRQNFVGVCKLEGKSASRTAEGLMEDYVTKRRASLSRLT